MKWLIVKGLALKAEMDWEANNEGVAWRESTFKAIVWDGWNIFGSQIAISFRFSAFHKGLKCSGLCSR